MCGFFDPRHKTLWFHTKAEANHVEALIIDQVVKWAEARGARGGEAQSASASSAAPKAAPKAKGKAKGKAKAKAKPRSKAKAKAEAQEGANPPEAPPEPRRVLKHQLQLFVDQPVPQAPAATGKPLRKLVKQEVFAYGVVPAEPKCDPLLWWKDRAEQFPLLSQFARPYLATAASSAAVERLFSVAGHLLHGRDRLGPEEVENVIMAHCAWAAVDFPDSPQ